MIEGNRLVVEHLNKLVSYYRIADNNIKANSFSRAANAISQLLVDVSDYDFNHNKIVGVGNSTINEIHEFLETGTSKRLKELESKYSNDGPNLDELQSVEGIGILDALSIWSTYKVSNLSELKKAIESGVITDPELINKVNPNNSLINFNNIKSMIEPLHYLLSLMSAKDKLRNPKCSYVGELRRGILTVKDINILLAIPDNIETNSNPRNVEDISAFLNSNKFNSEIIKSDLLKVKFIVENKIINCNIILTTSDEYACKLLYLTGSSTFVSNLITQLAKRNFIMNEYCVYKLINNNRELLKFDTEKDIFTQLNLNYVDPKDR